MPNRIRAALCKPAILAVALLGLSGAALATAGAASAATSPLQVTLGANASFNGAGQVVLDNGATGSATVNITLPSAAVPATPPSFTASAYAGGAPRWVISFSNGNFVTGYPVQIGTFAGVVPTTTFTGNQWGVGNGSSYTSYADALVGAGVTGSTTVTSAYVVADGGWDGEDTTTLTDLQYDGLYLSPGTVTVTNPGAQKYDVGVAITPLQITASTNTSDQALTYYLTGQVPAGLSISASGKISGTPSVIETGDIVTVTVADAYGDVNSKTGECQTQNSWSGKTMTSTDCTEIQFEIDTQVAPAPAPSQSSSSTSSSSGSSSSGTFPTGGVQTGGGKPAQSPWTLLGIILIAVGGLSALSLGAAGLRRRARRAQA